MQAEATVWHLLARGDFRRLLATRLLSQLGDGVFQAALAGTLLFNPQRAADPFDVALGFAVLLLPYSLVGPFAGVWLDRWSRRQVLLRANVLRAGLVAVVAGLVLGGVDGSMFDLAGLAVLSVSRFVLAALSAALPHTTDDPSLVSANALSTTTGALSAVVGGGTAVGLLQLTSQGNAAYAAVALGAAVPYLLSAAVARPFAPPDLGPDHPAGSPRLSVREVAAGLVAGARHVATHRPAAAALTAMGLHRLWYGLLTLLTLLLYRNTFRSGGHLFRGGLLGLGQVVGAAAAGTLLAAVLTPSVVRRIGKRRWMTALLAGAGLVQLVLGLPFSRPTVVAAGFALGFVAQAVKICVDTTVQEAVDDDFRGRVFSFYDTLFNVTFVAALLLAAVLLPASGVSYPVLIAVGVGYVLTAVLYARLGRLPTPPRSAPHRVRRLHQARSSASASARGRGPRSRRRSLR